MQSEAAAITADPTMSPDSKWEREELSDVINNTQALPSGTPLSTPHSHPHTGASWPVSACFMGGFVHPMQLLQARASELSGVSYEEAHEIDKLKLGEQIGEYNMMQMAESFNRRVLNDKDPWFRGMFSGKTDYPQNLNEYILQRLGGPSYYSDRKGNPGLLAKHRHFEMSPRTAERWLEYMDEALEEVETQKDISKKQRELIMKHFKWQAYVLVASQEAAVEMSTGGPRPPNTDKPACFMPTYATCVIDFSASAHTETKTKAKTKAKAKGQGASSKSAEGDESSDAEDEDEDAENDDNSNGCEGGGGEE